MTTDNQMLIDQYNEPNYLLIIIVVLSIVGLIKLIKIWNKDNINQNKNV